MRLRDCVSRSQPRRSRLGNNAAQTGPMIVAGDDAHEFEWQSAVHLASVNHRESEPSIVELRRLERIIYSFPPNAVAWRFGEVAGDEPRVNSVLSAPGPRRSRCQHGGASSCHFIAGVAPTATARVERARSSTALPPLRRSTDTRVHLDPVVLLESVASAL